MEQIRIIPKDLLCLIPKFEGDEGLLNLFLKKAQYVHKAYASAACPPAQQLYVFHAISSRLVGKAANLLSERDDITNFETLQAILIQHFGDPRSEECIAIELEQLKIKTGESYIEFCHRIQHTRSTLFAKVNLLTDEGVKAAKMIVYNNLSLNVFLFNLPEDLIRIVRLKGCTNLEAALSIVTEEVNFLNQYNAKKQARTGAQMPQRPALPQNNNIPTSNFKFGIPPTQGNVRPYTMPSQPLRHNPQQGFRPNLPFTQQGFRPNLPFNQPSGFRFNPPQQNFKFGMPQNQNFKFGIPQQGYRPQWNNQQPRQPQQFKFGIPQQQQPFPFTRREPLENTDVSMRTARPLRQNALEVPDSNEYYTEENNEPSDEQHYFDYNGEYEAVLDEDNAACNYIGSEENFMTQASTSQQP